MAENKKKIPNVVKSAAAVMAADILLLLGFVFLLLGASKFLNDFIGIEGSGEAIVGAALVIIGLIVISRSRLKVGFAPAQMGMAPPPQQKPPKEAPSDSYR